jgi:plastocyanin
MDDKCPKCGETLITTTIKKKIGLGSIDYPIAQKCPKCNWNKDLTGAGDIAPSPVMQDSSEAKKEEKKAEIKSEIKPSASTSSKPEPTSPTGINTLIPIILAILVVGAIAWVFFMNPAQKEQVDSPLKPTPTPVINQTPAQTPKSTPAPEVIASGKQISVKLENNRGLTPKTTTIKPGDEIVWTNEGTYAVTLVSSDGLFEDKLLNNAKRTNYIFKKPGTFSFYLKDDKSMTGIVIVEP